MSMKKSPIPPDGVSTSDLLCTLRTYEMGGEMSIRDARRHSGQAADLIESQAAEIERLRATMGPARDALDRLMGDTDINGDDSPEFRAMQTLSAALDGDE